MAWKFDFEDSFVLVNLVALACAVVYFFVWEPMRCRRSATEQAVALNVPAAPVVDLERAAAYPSATAKGRTAFIDNLKVCLTFVVVIHHVVCQLNGVMIFPGSIFISKDLASDAAVGTAFRRLGGWFTTANQDYFMAAFFFVSGYFTPRSLDKKGRYTFLKERVQRLGIPCIFMFFLVVPLWTSIAEISIFGSISGIGGANTENFLRGFVNLLPSNSPAWFILILLDFNVIYAFCHGEPVQLRAPGVGMLLLLGLTFGLWKVLVPYVPIWFSIPSGSQFLPFYVCCFCGGIMSNRNKWLDTFVEFPSATNNFLRGVVLFILMAALGDAFDLYNYTDASAKALGASMLAVLRGIYAVTMILVELQIFYRCFNGGGRFAKVLAEAAYGVYLLHPIFIIIGTWSFVKLVEATGMKVVKSPSEQIPYPGFQFVILNGTQSTLWLGVVYVSFVSNILVWPCAYGLKKLPVFRAVL